MNDDRPKLDRFSYVCDDVAGGRIAIAGMPHGFGILVVTPK
jgi:hypothetical protein